MADGDDKKPAAKKPAAPRARAAAKKPDDAAPKPARARAAATKSADTSAAKKPAAPRAAAKKADAAVAAPAKPTRTRAAAGRKAAEAADATALTAAAATSAAAETPAAKAPSAVEPPAPAPAPRERRHKQQVRAVSSVRAQAKYVRSSARKARLVCNHIRGKSVPEARAFLAFAPRGVARDWAKLLDSAVANAEHNHELLGDDLHVKEAYADEGPTLKRFRTRAMGRATPIHKRTSHLTITLGPKE
jgi:ribosomal protein L22